MNAYVKRVKLRFTEDLEIEFTDREQGIKQALELARKGTRFPLVVFGPEGCGKSAWLRQVAEIFKEEGFDTIYLNPLEKKILAEIGVKDVKERLLEILREGSLSAWARAVDALILLAQMLLEAGRTKIAILVDEAFQVIGTGKEAAFYVKGLLGLIEYPPKEYERIVAVVTTSEGLSRGEIGRHRWAELTPMWNMPREGFRELYERLPGEKPDFERVWKMTGGNPNVLARLYQVGWNAEKVVRRLREEKGITKAFVVRWREWLERAVEDPDTLWEPEAPQELVNELIEKNLIVFNLYERYPDDWIDIPPPEKDPELGIGRYVAWQTPLHREAVKRALETIGTS
jgi:energy-coupling factor transporter ATP-binding protein EcfA2